MCITLLFWPCMLQQLKKKRNFKQAIDLIVTDYYIYKLVIYLLSLNDFDENYLSFCDSLLTNKKNCSIFFLFSYVFILVDYVTM